MNKKTIITILLALVAMAGQGQVPLESVKELTMKSEYFNPTTTRTLTRPTTMSSMCSMHKTARCSILYTVCSTSPASPTPTAAKARISSSWASAHQPFGTSTIFATTTTCPCPCMATPGCSRRAITTASRPI